ncbi:hypothetical protein [Pelagimonas phthalicica]|nr:hypothetical protein [Pelagimonas phthalicica]
MTATEAGTWIGSLFALSLLLGVLYPQLVTTALPAAGLAVSLGGVIFSLISHEPPALPELMLLGVTLPISVISALLYLWGARRVILIATLAGAWQIALVHILSTAPITSPFLLFPWIIAPIILTWIVTGALIQWRSYRVKSAR